MARTGTVTAGCALGALLLSLSGCGGGGATSRPTVQGNTPSERDGRSPETAWHACFDTRSDYRRVAEYRCADGSMPLEGDLRAGGAARRGNVGAGPDGHILDLYDVPCPGGAVQIYVDGYHCDEELAPLSDAEIQQALVDLRRYTHSPEDMSDAVMSRGMTVVRQLGVVLPECRHVFEMVVPTEAENRDWRFIGSIFVAGVIVGAIELHLAQGPPDPRLARTDQMAYVRAAAVTFFETYRRLIAAGEVDLRTARLDQLATLPQAELEEEIDSNITMCTLESMVPGSRVQRGGAP